MATVADNVNMMYFIGIGGIGMSSLARYYKSSGIRVSGYDLTCTPLTLNLEKEGMEIIYDDDAYLVDELFFKTNRESILVVYTPAIPPDNKILQHFIRGGYRVIKRSQLLGQLVNEKTGIAVAGTHGKTSVSAITAHILQKSGIGCTAFLGGIARNYDSNLIVDKSSEYIVVEADEYDRSFLQLYPFTAIITSMDPDHLDIYESFDRMKEAYFAFARQVRDQGYIIYKKGIDAGFSGENNVNSYSYSIDGKADFYAFNIRIPEDGHPVFDFKAPDAHFAGLRLGVPGRFNVENAVAAIAAARICGAGEQEIRDGLLSFRGIARRLEIIINRPDCVLIDDYAHHPAELSACISAVREIFPGRNLTGIFQPHLYSRTRDFAEGFGKSLEALDNLILLDIYPARELPVPGVSSALIFNQADIESKIICKREELPAIISEMETDIVLMLGAGNIDAMVEPVRKILMHKLNTKENQ
jgi:UDP-N-acetylmuramate--alanine ligase